MEISIRVILFVDNGKGVSDERENAHKTFLFADLENYSVLEEILFSHDLNECQRQRHVAACDLHIDVPEQVDIAVEFFDLFLGSKHTLHVAGSIIDWLDSPFPLASGYLVCSLVIRKERLL